MKVVALYDKIRYSITDWFYVMFCRLSSSIMHKHDNPEPLVTVYVPTYNRSEIIRTRALPSIVNQTYRNIEIIVVSDGSTDDTSKCVQEFNDHRIRLIEIKRQKRRYPPTAKNHWLAGPVYAANAALKAARGEWIARIDDDEEWTKDHIQKSLDYIRKNNYEFVTSDSITYIDNKSVRFDGHYMYSEYFGTKSLMSPSKENNKIGGTSTIFYKSCLKRLKYNKRCWMKSHNAANDIDLYVRMVRAGVRIGHLYEVTNIQLPRPGETAVGWEGYRLTSEQKEKFYSSE